MSILESAARVFRLLADREGGLTVTDVVDSLGLPKSSSSRLLKQMMECGLLERDLRSLAYRPSLLMLEVAHKVHAHTPLLTRMEQALQALVDETGHTGYISVLDEGARHVVVVRALHGSHSLRVVTRPGHRLPAYATSTGRALLARLDDATVAARFHEPLEAPHLLTPNAPRNVAALTALLHEVRERGWAYALDETLAGVGSVSATVHDPDSDETLAFCLSFPASLSQPGLADALAQRLVGHARSIGRAAGDSFWNTPS
jgi:DNA-binding IclR family transcriptional regulator